ncbi:MAG TPA: hypothetical protein PKG95_08315 [Anaerolineaceae bacterium]|jgi:hypothetical protein|nr:hypothetical protein [Anaerolineaceae bacterium]
MDLGTIYTSALQLVWKHKWLWLLGILASIYNVVVFAGSLFQTVMASGRAPVALSGQFLEVLAPETIKPFAWVLIGLSALALAALLGYVLVSAQAALARAIWQIRTEPTAAPHFNQLWRFGQPYFWRVLWFNLLIGVLTTGIGLVVGGLWLAASYFCGVLFFLLIILVGALGVLTGLIHPLGVLAIVSENRTVLPALRRAWVLLRTRWGDLLYLWFITTLISLVVHSIVLTPILLVIMAGLAQGHQTGLPSALLILGGLAVMFILGLLTVFLQAVWRNGFEESTTWLTEIKRMKAETAANRK